MHNRQRAFSRLVVFGFFLVATLFCFSVVFGGHGRLQSLRRSPAPAPQHSVLHHLLNSTSVDTLSPPTSTSISETSPEDVVFADIVASHLASLPSCTFSSKLPLSRRCADLVEGSAAEYHPLPPLDLAPNPAKPVVHYQPLPNRDNLDVKSGQLTMGQCPEGFEPYWFYPGFDSAPPHAWREPVRARKHDYVKTFCYDDDEERKALPNFFNYPRRRRDVHERAQAMTGGGEWARDKPNVVVFMQDAISRGSLFREFPNFMRALVDYVDSSEDATLLDFTRFNVVGRNSIPNKIPLLTGGTPEEFAGLHTLWDDFGDAGYVTHVAESVGFPEKYSLPQDVPSSEWSASSIWRFLTKTYSITRIDHPMNTKILSARENNCKFGPESQRRYAHTGYCIGPRPRHEYLLQHLSHFWELYHDVPKFSYMNPFCSHGIPPHPYS